MRISGNIDEFYREAAGEFARLSREAVIRRGHFTVALSGGTTPAGLYELLTDESEPYRAIVPWGEIHFFFGDERHVGPEDPKSNYRMAHTALLSKVPVERSSVHRIEGENPDPQEAAAKYEEAVREFFQIETGGLPSFDLILLGMGADGHTASLFPGSEAIHERERLVAAPWVEKIGAYRITLTPPVLERASCVVFLVCGEEKAETLRFVLQGDYQPERFPAQLASAAAGRTLFITDHLAARLLDMEGLREEGGER